MLPPDDQLYRTLYEKAPVGLAFLAVDGTVLAVNQGACDLFARPQAELVGAALPVLGEERPQFDAQLAELASGASANARAERRVQSPSGYQRWTEQVLHAVIGANGRPEYVQVVIVDISGRKSEDEIQAWLASIVDSSQEAIVSTTLDGVVLNWNKGAERIFGYTAAEMIGQQASMLRPESAEKEIVRLTRRIQRGERIENRVVRLRKNGSKVTLLSVSTPIVDASGEVVGTATISRDLDERERADAMFRSLLEAAPDAVVCVDERGIVALVNAQAEALFGYDRDELVGQSIEMLVPASARIEHPSLRDQYVAAPAARPMRSRTGHRLSARRKDGSEFPAEISLSAVMTQDGLLVSAAIRDGTERNSAAIVASSSDAIVGRGLDGVVHSWNAGAERLFGYRAVDAVGTDMASMIPAGHLDELTDLVPRVAAGEPVPPFETQRIRSDGTVVDVSVTVSPILGEDGAVRGMAVVTRDITESKRALEALRQVEARKSAILESALDAVISMDDQGKVVEFNPAAERVFGYQRAEVLGQSLADLIIPPELRDAHRLGLEQYLRSGEGPLLGQRVELTGLTSEGAHIPVEVSITRVALPGPALFTAYLRDITDRRQAEEERAVLSQRVRTAERLESLGQLAGGVAHDFNNLIGVIANYAAFIAEQTASDPQVTADVQQIQAAAERAARLTSQLLIVGRREAIALELLDLNTIVTEIHDMLSRSIGEHIELMLNLGTALPAARFDRSQLEQVLLNLAINARDAMPTGGMLSIRTRFLEVDADFVRGHPDMQVGPYVELAVSDSGMGMTREVIDRAFDPFFTTKPQGQGTGLGLATVYGVVTGAGGLVMIYSEPGLGTTVRVLLPAASEPAAEPPAPPDLTAAGQGETVVVVDDEAAMMEVAARILRRAGYTVLATTTPTAAIELIEDNDVSLLLTDCVMPGMSGLQLAQEALLIRPALAVLFMSGYDQGMLGAQQLVADEAELIRKPFNAEQLVERVAARLR